jgi:hypothetical protein
MTTSLTSTSNGALAHLHLPDLAQPGHPAVIEEWIQRPVLRLVGASPCLIVDIKDCPHRTYSGRHVIPAQPRAALRRLAQLGVDFPKLAVLHELDPGAAVQQVLPMLREGPVTCSSEVARAVVGPLPEHPGLRRTADTLDAVLLRGRRAVGATVGRTGRLLDPIIFGVVALDGSAPVPGEPALWYPLVAWRW